MLNKNIQPSTIGGIKRLAKQLKKTNDIPHHEALDIAARNATFENFTHALNKLKNSHVIKSGCQLFFTVYWYDSKSHKTGREVLEVELSIPLLDMATKSELKNARDLGWFRLVSPDHLLSDHISTSQEEAINRICKAVRMLRFIEATGLKPCKDTYAAYPNRDYKNRLPDSDHSTIWNAPGTGQTILVDEPYLDPAVSGKRAEWAKKYNWHLETSKWPGMYSPGDSNMFVSTDASTGYDFQALMAKIDNIPYMTTEKNWTGISSKGFDTFFSPLCVTPQDKKRAVAKGTIYRAPSSKTQPMRVWGTPYNLRRPNAVMSIDSHQRAARLIKAIALSDAKPVSVNACLSSIKSKLEDWFFSEYDKNVTDRYGLFYYGGIDNQDPFVLKVQMSNGVVNLLNELKAILLNAYVDCEPLRKLMAKVDTSIKLASQISSDNL